MTTSRKIVFTGGGSPGHVIPNLEIISALQQQQWQVSYVGSYNGVESQIVSRHAIPYYGISAGKFRRYFSWANFSDPFKILYGVVEAYRHLANIKPALVFSKGGFVAFPVVLAAWLRRIPVIAHESDFSPGLANKLSFPFAKWICLTFADAKKFFKNPQKLVVTGTPIRSMLFKGDAPRGRQLCGFNNDKPCLMVIGGGQGALAINEKIRTLLPRLLEQMNIIHLCGKGKLASEFQSVPGYEGYKQFEYVDEELPHLFAAASIVISRSGANSVYEILALKKPHIFIPLPLSASRGDQIFNARFFAKQGLSTVLDEDTLTSEQLLAAINDIEKNYDTIQAKIANYDIQSGTHAIVDLIEKTVRVC